MLQVKKGQAVVVALTGAGFTTREDYVVEKVTKDKVWVDGLDAPFDRKTGISENCYGGFVSQLEVKSIR